jgi:murein DD-endopeptidase MepM/ murein hydrolase activator NlpD
MPRASRAKLSVAEIMGFTAQAPAQTWLTLRGDPSVPPSRFGLSSLRVFTPRLALATWAGKRLFGRKVPVFNLFNRVQTPVEEGWSVRVTQVRDFRGRGLTYDSHNGTDFAVVPGTRVAASAPGRVVAIRSEYNRGGLKVYIDHGGGLLTTYNHLGRALCRVGDDVGRGDVIALSAYSGLDGLVAFPWVAPHIHYNTALGGVLVDPFAADDDAEPIPLWRDDGGLPTAHRGGDDRAFSPTRFDPRKTAALLADLRPDDRRSALAREPDDDLRAWGLVIEAMTYPTRFASAEAGRMVFEHCPRRATLDLPVHRDEGEGIVFADDVALRRAEARSDARL